MSKGNKIRARSLTEHSVPVLGLIRLLDAILVGGGLWLVCRGFGTAWEEGYALVASLAVVMYLLIAENCGLYRSWRVGGLRQEIDQILVAWAGMVAVLLMLGYVSKTSAEFSRRVLLAWCATGPPVIVAGRIAGRWLARKLRTHGWNQRRTAIAGAGALGWRLAETIVSSPWMGLQLAGLYDDGPSADSPPERGKVARLEQGGGVCPKIRGTLRELVAAAQRGDLDLVYLALPMRDEDGLRDLVRALASTPVSVHFVPDLLPVTLLRSRWFMLGGFPTVNVIDAPNTGLEAAVKRVEDIVLASLILVLISVPMLIIIAAVKVTSPGPAIFKQKRYGLDGREIVVWKFRTMRVCEGDNEFRQATRADPRVTRLGAFLRCASLDELPQFINVLQGRMSIVGPRPHPLLLDHQHRELIDWYTLRTRVKPGITGWAQINGFRGETDTLEKMRGRIEHDLQYIRNWSIGLDLKILFLTVVRGFVGRNAY